MVAYCANVDALDGIQSDWARLSLGKYDCSLSTTERKQELGEVPLARAT